ncbi:MAG: tetratricopeptide repeat protein [Gemmatimonadota bacterium]|nr:MAG: tetratricopeptide repeat protein [Gemmatimonadota bacterium]
MPDKSLLQRLKERRLVQWAVAYLAGAWLVFQGIEVVADPWNLSAGLQRTLHLLLIIGFFVTLVLAWYHGEKGRQRASGPELLMIAALLAIAAILLTIVRPKQEAATIPESVSAVAGARPAVAILPFENISPNPEDAYFADGMHEQITSQLSQVSAIRVISRTSVMQYREARPPARQIAGELGVNYLLEGSARKAEDRVRLTVQLIDADRDEHVWADEYDRDLTAAHLFEIQSEVAERVASALEVELTASERQRIERHPTENLAAYDLYLLGRYYWNQLDAEGLERAVEYFEGALDLDPDFALAHTGLADTYMMQTQGWGLAPRDVFPKAREAATQALELDPTLAEAHASLGHVQLFYDWDWEGAEAAFRRAIELNPNYAPAPHWLAMCLMARARYTEAIQAVQQALALDPQSPYVRMNVGYILYVSRQYDRALAEYSDALAVHANALMHALRGGVYVQQGLFDEGISDIELAAEMLEGRNLIPAAYLGFAYARAGRRDDAERVLWELQEISAERFVNPDYIAIVLIGLGENDQAIEWLRRATEARTDWPVFFPVDPVTDSIRSDPRYQELLRRVGLAELIE